MRLTISFSVKMTYNETSLSAGIYSGQRICKTFKQEVSQEKKKQKCFCPHPAYGLEQL